MNKFGPQVERNRNHEDLIQPQSRNDVHGFTEQTRQPSPTFQSPPLPDYNLQTGHVREMKQYEEYLKSMVRKLSQQLSVYQTKYAPIGQEEMQVLEQQGSGSAPWILNSEYMTPIMIAYESRLKDADSEILLYQKKLESVHGDFKALIQENDDLRENLSAALSNKVKEASQSQTFTMDNLEWKDVQERLTMLEQENQALDQERQTLQEEVDRLNNDKKKFNQSVSAMSSDNNKVRTILNRARENIRNSQNERDQYKKELITAQRSIKQLHRELARVNAEVSSNTYTDSKLLRQKELEMSQMEDQIQLLKGEIDTLVREKQSLMKTIGESEERIARHQTHEFNALNKLKEMNDQLEELKLRLHNSETSDNERKRRITELDEKLRGINRENSEKLKAQREELEDKFNQEVLAFREKVSKLQNENIQLEERYKRAEREKKNAEFEVTKVIKAAESEHITPPKIVADLTRKLSIATNERDEIERMYDNLRGVTKRSQLSWEQEREQLASKNKELQKKLDKVKEEISELKNENESLNKELDEAQKNLENVQFQQEEEDRDRSVKSNERVSLFKKENSNLKRKVELLEEKETKLTQELTDTQFKLEQTEIRWKGELAKRTESLESHTQELKSEVTRLRNKSDELENRLHKANKERSNITMLKETLEDSERKLHSQLKIVQRRANDSGNEIKRLLEKEAQLLEEKKELQLKIERFDLELERSKRQKIALTKKLDDLKNDYDHIVHIQGIFRKKKGTFPLQENSLWKEENVKRQFTEKKSTKL